MGKLEALGGRETDAAYMCCVIGASRRIASRSSLGLASSKVLPAGQVAKQIVHHHWFQIRNGAAGPRREEAWRGGAVEPRHGAVGPWRVEEARSGARRPGARRWRGEARSGTEAIIFYFLRRAIPPGDIPAVTCTTITVELNPMTLKTGYF